MKRANSQLRGENRFYWKQRAVELMRGPESRDFEHYFRAVERPLNKNADEEYRLKKIGYRERAVQSFVSTLNDNRCDQRFWNLVKLRSANVNYSELLFTPNVNSSDSSAAAAAGSGGGGGGAAGPELFRDVLYTKHSIRASSKQCHAFLGSVLAAEDAILRRTHPPYAAAGADDRLAACIAMSFFNAGQTHRITRILGLVQSQCGVSRGWLQELMCLLLYRVHMCWIKSLEHKVKAQRAAEAERKLRSAAVAVTSGDENKQNNKGAEKEFHHAESNEWRDIYRMIRYAA